MSNLTAVLFQTHILSRTVMRQFRKLQRQSPPGHHPVLLVHAPAGTPKPEALEAVPHHFITTPELRELGYPAKPAGGGAGAAWNVATAGDTDLLLLHFWKARRGVFDRFWGVEYDVRYSGDWRTFFDAFSGNDADLLAAAMVRHENDPDRSHWPTLRVPRAESARGDGTPAAGVERITALLPVFRVSDRAAAAVDAACADGWGGHCEIIWPTVLHRRGMRIEDMGGDGEFVAPGNRGRFYSDGTFAYRPSRVAAGWRRDTLWHPVKPLSAGVARKLGRAAAKLRGADIPVTWNPAPRFPGEKRDWRRWLARPFRSLQGGVDQ